MMKNFLIFINIIFIFTNCLVGTERDACRYNLNKSKPVYCTGETASIFLIPPSDGNYQEATERASQVLIQCLIYYEKLKDCDKDNNRFKPGFYGINWFYFENSKTFNRNYSMNTEFNHKEKTSSSSQPRAKCLPPQRLWQTKLATGREEGKYGACGRESCWV
jgi:hypothetical protein